MIMFNKILGNAEEECPELLMQKYGKLLIDEELVEMGFQLVRDTFVFTNKRLIVIDVQGLTGSKTEYSSIPYKSISRFSLETSGSFDLDAELKVWISNGDSPALSKKINKKVDVYKVQKFLASKVL